MRKVFYLVLSLVIASCTSNNELQEKLAFIDVTEEYPEKKIELTDIAGVSYLHLNSNIKGLTCRDSGAVSNLLWANGAPSTSSPA